MLLQSMSDVNKCFMEHFPKLAVLHATALDQEFLSHSHKLSTSIDGVSLQKMFVLFDSFRCARKKKSLKD